MTPAPSSRTGRAERREIDVPARSAFVGREGAMRALGKCIGDGARLVTITGAGGMGKTRLALEWARSAETALQHGGASLFFCDLSEARGIDDACAALARALATPLAAGGTADEAVTQLGRALAEAGPCVIILDNMEQLAPLAPRMLDPWLVLAPRAQLVVTSRERLRLPDEVCLELEPLGVPAAEERSLQVIASSEAVALFVARTRAVRFDFALTEADAHVIAAIVRQVDGIPLAIELCAARMGLLAPKQILARLSQRFELLVTGARGAPARKATLRGAIDVSWDLLASWEKDALAQCSVFRGGFSLEAAEAVLELGAGRGEGTPPPILDVLQALHDKSLLRAFDARGSADERRFSLLESIREYAEERLSELGATAGAIARHAAFFLGMGSANGSALLQSTDIRRLALEVDNLLAVCTRALARRPLSPGDADTALRGLLLLEPVLLTCSKGRLEPYVAMLDAALEAASTPIDPVIRARALYTRALADLLRGRVLDGLLGFQRALEAARAAGSRADEARALTKLGVLLDRGDFTDEARARFDEARAIAIELGDPALHADWMLTQGAAFIWRGRAADAVWYAEQAVEGFRVAGDLRWQATASAQLALVYLSLARFEEAELAARRTLDLLEATEDRRTEGYVLGVLGRIAQSRGQFGEARAQLAAGLAIHRAVGDRWSEGAFHGFLGNVAFEEGLLEEALLDYREAVELLDSTGEQHYAIIFRAALGAVEIGRGRAEIAASYFEAATAKLAGIRVLTTRTAVDLCCAHADAARAREAAAAGDLEAAERHRGLAAARIVLAQAAPGGALSPALCSEDVRFGIRLLERALALPAALGPPAAAPASPLPSSRSMLIVGPEARWFRLRDREPVHLLKARAARLMLFRLVRGRIDAAGRAISLDELFEAGWPGERIQRRAAANRVYVTLTKLRQLGLQGMLQSRDDGFLLDPAAVVLEALDLEPPMGPRGASGT
jgi:predicted ATPase